MFTLLTFKSFLPPQALRHFRAVSLDGVEEVVDGDDVVAVLHELQHRVGADEAPGAGHEDGLTLAHIDANISPKLCEIRQIRGNQYPLACDAMAK